MEYLVTGIVLILSIIIVSEIDTGAVKLCRIIRNEWYARFVWLVLLIIILLLGNGVYYSGYNFIIKP